MALACQEALWLRQLAAELDPKSIPTVIMIYSDNKGTTDLAFNSGYRQRTKHIDIRHHLLREKIEDEFIAIKHIQGE